MRADHLGRLASDEHGEHSTTDGGLGDVLQTFAQSLGYKVSTTNFYKGRAQDEFRGMIDPPSRQFFIAPTDDLVARADTIAHEITHHYIYYSVYYGPFRFDYWLSEALEEQVAEAVACAILYDYGVDRMRDGRCYVAEYSPPKRFYRNGVDKLFRIVYPQFSQELIRFLEGGTTCSTKSWRSISKGGRS